MKVKFNELTNANLEIDAIYEGGTSGNVGDDPISKLFPKLGNMSGFRKVKRKDNPSKFAYVVLYTSMNELEWPDYLDKETGVFRYYGDNRQPGRNITQTKQGGNKLLEEVFATLNSKDDLIDIPPFFVFKKGEKGRDVQFLGLAAPGNPSISPDRDLVAFWRTIGDNRFQNYESYFTILDTKDKSYSLTMMINPEIVKTSDVIVINCNSKSISFSPNELSYSINEVVDGLVTKNVTIKGNNITNEAAILIAEFNLVKTACAINVIDSDIHYPENGLEFYPKEIALVEDVNHKVKLYFDKAIVPIGTKIKISCNNLVTVETMEVNESNLIKDNIGFIAIPVKGGSVGKSYKIEASACEIKSKAIITIIEQSSPYMRNGGMFSGIILEPSDGFFQSYFHLGTQQIVINPKNIINRTMLGDFKNCDPENPSFSADQLKYIYEIMATEAAYVLLAGKEVKNNVIDTSDVENAVEQIRNSIQRYKNNVYAQLVLNENDKDIQTSIL